MVTIKAVCIGKQQFSAGDRKLVHRFLKDSGLVLRALEKASFEPPESVDQRWVSVSNKKKYMCTVADMTIWLL